MRFMILVRADEQAEAGVLPSKELVAAMGRYAEEMARAGVLLAADGLRPSSHGVRVRYSAGKPTVTDGPFTETKELISGYWLIQVRSREEAVEWASRVPFEQGEVEVREVSEPTDLPDDTYGDEIAREQELRRQMQQRQG